MDIHYRIQGTDSQFPIIMVHGLAGDSRFFHKQLKFLGEYYKTIAIDLPGHGNSPYMDNLSFDLYSRCIDEVTEKEKIGNYILAGHSMGGTVCINNYFHNRGRVKALILISAASKLPMTETMINESCEDFHAFYIKLLTTIFYKKGGIFAVAAQKNLNDNDKKIIMMDMQLCSGINYDDLLKEINIPVLLIANKYDEMVPLSLTVDMQKKIRNSKITIFDDEGHVPFFENSDEFNKVIYEFIESLQLK